jgi:hypothetical protein
VRNVSDIGAEKIKTRILYAVTFSFYFEIRAVYEIMWKNMVQPAGQMTIWRMRFARWIPKSTNTH